MGWIKPRPPKAKDQDFYLLWDNDQVIYFLIWILSILPLILNSCLLKKNSSLTKEVGDFLC